jgi:ABC-type iron transport system FetAB permease component
MTFKQLIQLLPKVVRYNLKIIFAGKFFWFLLAAFGFFALFMFQNAWKREEINEGLIYSILMFPSMLLIFYPAVFGIQNDKIAGYWRFSLESPTISIRFGACGY